MNSSHVLTLSRHLFHSLRGSQQKTIAACAQGLLEAGRVGVASIGRGMEGPAQPRSRARRVERFISNPGVDHVRGCAGLIAKLIPRHRRSLLTLDWTHHGDEIRIEAGLVTGSRTLPLFWWVIPTDDLGGDEGSQNLIEEGFILHLLYLIPPGRDVVLLADRGFGRASLLQFLGEVRRELNHLSLSWIIRILGDVWVRKPDGETLIPKEQPVHPGQIWDLGLVEYRLAKAKNGPGLTRTRLVIAHGMDAKEPWLLATNLIDLPQAIAGGYARRFECEEFFRTQKDHRFGFGLKLVRLKEPVRLERMLLIVALACLTAFIAGVAAENKNLHRVTQLNTRKKRELSLIRLGIHWFRKIRLQATQLLKALSLLALNPIKALFEGTTQRNPPWKTRIRKSDSPRLKKASTRSSPQTKSSRKPPESMILKRLGRRALKREFLKRRGPEVLTPPGS